MTLHWRRNLGRAQNNRFLVKYMPKLKMSFKNFEISEFHRGLSLLRDGNDISNMHGKFQYNT